MTGRVVYVNDYACKTFAGERGDLVGEIDLGPRPCGAAGVLGETWARVVAEGAIEFPVDRRQADGSRLVLDVTANYLEAADVLVTYGRDITRRVVAEESLQAEQINLEAIFEASPVAMLVCDAGANVVRVNRAALRLAGSDEQRLLEHRPDSERAVRRRARRACTTSRRGMAAARRLSARCARCATRSPPCSRRRSACAGSSFSMDVLRDDEPEEVWLRVGAEPMVMDGAPHVTVAVDDVTDRRRAERDLRESEERFEQFADHFPGYFYMHDADLRYVYTNRPEATDGGVVRASWLGKRPTEIWPSQQAADAEVRLRSVLEKGQLDEIVPWEAQRAGRAPAFSHLPHPPRREASADRRPLRRRDRSRWRPQEEVRRQAEQLRRTVEGAVLAMSQVVETRDPYTAGHERRVAELATVHRPGAGHGRRPSSTGSGSAR